MEGGKRREENGEKAKKPSAEVEKRRAQKPGYNGVYIVIRLGCRKGTLLITAVMGT